MSSVGWVLAIGAVSLANQISTAPEGTTTFDYVTVPTGTVVAAVTVSLLERLGAPAGWLVAVAGATAMLAPISGSKAPITTMLELYRIYTKHPV